MKTLKSGSKIIRVKDNDTDRYLKDGYSFCPKSEWKNSKKVKNDDADVGKDEEKVKKKDKKK